MKIEDLYVGQHVGRNSPDGVVTGFVEKIEEVVDGDVAKVVVTFKTNTGDLIQSTVGKLLGVI